MPPRVMTKAKVKGKATRAAAGRSSVGLQTPVDVQTPAAASAPVAAASVVADEPVAIAAAVVEEVPSTAAEVAPDVDLPVVPAEQEAKSAAAEGDAAGPEAKDAAVEAVVVAAEVIDQGNQTEASEDGAEVSEPEEVDEEGEDGEEVSEPDEVDEDGEDGAEVSEQVEVDEEGDDEEEGLEENEDNDPHEDFSSYDKSVQLIDVESQSEDDNEADPSKFLPIQNSVRIDETEIIIDYLAENTEKDDIIKVFSKIGKIEAVEIVKRSPQDCKGYAFLRFATVEAAKKALVEFKDGVEVKGKKVSLLVSADYAVLSVSNICRTWSKEQVLNNIKALGVEGVTDIFLPAAEEPNGGGRNTGFAHLYFSCHSGALLAFQRLRQRDAVLGCDISAKVSIIQTPAKQEEPSKAKNVHLKCIPESWDEDKIKEKCSVYGEILNIRFIGRNISKRRNYAFVDFADRQSALACIEGINNSHIREGEFELVADISKGRNCLARGGGFKVRNVRKTNNLTSRSGKNKTTPKKATGKERVGSKRRTGNRITPHVDGRPSKKQRKNRNLGRRPDREDFGHHSSKRGALHSTGLNYSYSPSVGAYLPQSTSYSYALARAAEGNLPHPTSYSYVPARTPGTNLPHSTSYSYSDARTVKTDRRHSDLQPHAGYIPSATHTRGTYVDKQRATHVAGPGLYDPANARGSALPNASYIANTVYPNYQIRHAYPPGASYPEVPYNTRRPPY